MVTGNGFNRLPYGIGVIFPIKRLKPLLSPNDTLKPTVKTVG
jgi:hypothetical protein